jgi:hypothetical protein
MAPGAFIVYGFKQDGEYVNDSYGKTPHKITLDVQGGIGEIELLAE